MKHKLIRKILSDESYLRGLTIAQTNKLLNFIEANTIDKINKELIKYEKLATKNLQILSQFNTV